MSSQSNKSLDAAPGVQDWVSLARPASDASQLHGDHEEADAAEGDGIIRALKGLSSSTEEQRRWRLVRPLLRAAEEVDDEWDELAWDETETLLQHWPSQIEQLTARVGDWWQRQRQAVMAGLAAMSEPQWAARQAGVDVPLVSLPPLNPTPTPHGLRFVTQVGVPASLELQLPSARYLALLQLDQDPALPPALLYPTASSQHQPWREGRHQLLQLRFPEAGTTRLVLFFSETPFDAQMNSLPDETREALSAPNWSEALQEAFVEGLFAHADRWEPWWLEVEVEP